MPSAVMLHEIDPKQVLIDKLGDLAPFELFHDAVLCAVYQRPEKTKSGIYLTDQHRDEDRSQGKVGLVVKMGSRAFQDDEGRWDFPDIALSDWVFYRASDGWAVTINGVLCRILLDTRVIGRIQHPDMVW